MPPFKESQMQVLLRPCIRFFFKSIWLFTLHIIVIWVHCHDVIQLYFIPFFLYLYYYFSCILQIFWRHRVPWSFLYMHKPIGCCQQISPHEDSVCSYIHCSIHAWLLLQRCTQCGNVPNIDSLPSYFDTSNFSFNIKHLCFLMIWITIV